MNRPNPMTTYPEIDLKLGIKSSFPNVRSALAMIILLWMVSDSPGELEYSVENGDKIKLTNELSTKIISKIADYQSVSVDTDSLLEIIDSNPIFTSQMESLIVAFELIWKLAKVEFSDNNKPYSAERTGKKRYPKKFVYTINIDIINILINTNQELYLYILLRWIGLDISYIQHGDLETSIKNAEIQLIELLTLLSEGAVFKLVDGNEEVLFNLDSIYSKLLTSHHSIDINGDKEPKGSLRILKSLLHDNLNSFLNYANNEVSIVSNKEVLLKNYQKRVSCYLQLSSKNVNTCQSNIVQSTHCTDDNLCRQRIFFGAPGTGKSYSLNEAAKSLVSNKSDHIERVTFHPDYTYANFVGAYRPVMKQSDIVCSDDDSKEIFSVLKDTTKTTQEKYDALYERFKNTGNLTRIPMILGLYSDDEFETRKADGTKTSDNNSVERNHGRALRKYVQLLSEESYKEKIAYEYVPGPFIRLLVKALKNPSDPYVLIVEEINRANVAAVFGDVFQLLDRNNDGESEYSITTTADMRVYLQHELGKDKDVTTIKIPTNMFIWATMNSADQGVYPMDTAFKRRWTFSYYGLDDGETKLSDVAIQPQFTLGKSSKLIAWNSLRKAINDELSTDTYNTNEDKLMGPFFLKEEAFKDNTSFNEAFKNKVLMYLFDDVVKQKRRSFFKCENSNRYSSICHAFDLEGVKIFPDGVVNSKWLQEAEPVTSEDEETRATKV